MPLTRVMQIPEPGQLVDVRHRRYVVVEVTASMLPPPILSTGITRLLEPTEVSPVLTFLSSYLLVSLKIFGRLSVFLSLLLSASIEETSVKRQKNARYS